MPSFVPASGPERLLWIVIIALIVGYLAGVSRNRQRSKALGAWLQAGLGALGGRVAWRWIRSMNSGAQVTVAEARHPFRTLELAYYLVTREFTPLWLIEVIRGKRDLLSVRADLRTAPEREFEIVPAGGRLRKQLDEGLGDGAMQWTDGPAGLAVGTRGQADRALRQRATVFLNTYGPYVERLSVRKRAPNVVAFFRLTGLEKQPSEELWRGLERLLKG